MKRQSRTVLVLLCACLLATAWAMRARSQSGDDAFNRWDKDKDGYLAREEIPRRVADRRVKDLDKDGDMKISREEFASLRKFRGRGDDDKGLPKPDFDTVSYGTHERQVYDVWKAPSDDPTPLVLYIHGGGFRVGDRRSLNPQMLKQLRDAGVSVAAINYRLSDTARFPAAMHDCARALQHIRYHAADYGIDPNRMASTGGSAGAGISQWLAAHDDLAKKDSEDPIERESTRLTCVAVFQAQTSYDPRFIHELFDTTRTDLALRLFFGIKDDKDYEDPAFHALFEEASPIHHATADDVPVMLLYRQPNRPPRKNSSGPEHIHHPKFGQALKEKLDELGVECVVRLHEDYEKDAFAKASVSDAVSFMLKHLGVSRESEATEARESDPAR